jgi:hypothetical protein
MKNYLWIKVYQTFCPRGWREFEKVDSLTHMIFMRTRIHMRRPTLIALFSSL